MCDSELNLTQELGSGFQNGIESRNPKQDSKTGFQNRTPKQESKTGMQNEMQKTKHKHETKTK